ncbi:MAG: glutamine--fructose-6-phosphate aminotransferase, partial [Thermoplasmata archaeon]|nr:glutamine--fructose-6-phosphate aminotransferase [Thermoplasmata archaeon]
MCGIIGYRGQRTAAPLIVKGLQRLEYRGYDSAGVAVVEKGKLRFHKRKGSIQDLIISMPELGGFRGIGHTRWATHGVPSEDNAHPHMDRSGSIAVVHNGIIENYIDIREELVKEGVKFRSETDTEVIPHLIAKYYDGSLKDAVERALKGLHGSFALAVIHSDEDVVVGARMDSPLIMAVGDGEVFLASDMPAVLEHTNRVVYLQNGDIVTIDPDGYRIWDGKGEEVHREEDVVDLNLEDAEKGGYSHFMLKEIF